MGRHLGCLQYVALIADALRNILYISIFFFAHINKINNNFLGVELLCQRLYVLILLNTVKLPFKEVLAVHPTEDVGE